MESVYLARFLHPERERGFWKEPSGGDLRMIIVAPSEDEAQSIAVAAWIDHYERNLYPPRDDPRWQDYPQTEAVVEALPDGWCSGFIMDFH